MKHSAGILLISAWISGGAFAGPLQDAINAAPKGAVIDVPSGTHVESVILKDGMTLVGAGAAHTVIDGNGADAVIRMGKDAAVIGCTLRNGKTGVHNLGRFIGVFECDIRDMAEQGIRIEGGSACLANNIIAAGTNANGVICTAANPYIGHNVIQSNKVGLLVRQHFVPVVDHNVFQGNETAVLLQDGARVISSGNIFSLNATAINGQEPGEGDVTREITPEELASHRGSSVAAYRQMMKKVFDEAAALQPRVTYDLADTPGRFHLAVAYPWASFNVLASARDTVIEAYDAYDRSTDKDLNARYVTASGHPAVAVINPDVIEKNLDRYVLEKIFVHPPSLTEAENGQLIFDRVTNIPRIEVIAPPGYRIASVNHPAEGVVVRGRESVRMTDMGMTRVRVIMERRL